MLVMFSYIEEVSKINNLLNEFVKSRKIEIDKLNSMDNLISFSKENQINTLNSGYLTLKEEIVLFGVMTNIKNTLESMKERLKVASERHENPTTAELALEIMPSFDNLEPFINDFVNNRYLHDIERLDDFSRILHRKAHKLGFSKDIKSQFKEADVTVGDVQEFMTKLKNNIEIELDVQMGDDQNEDINRYVSSD